MQSALAYLSAFYATSIGEIAIHLAALIAGAYFVAFHVFPPRRF